MKKRKINDLSLNKTTISNLEKNEIRGGGAAMGTSTCLSHCKTKCWWDPPCWTKVKTVA